MSQNDSCWGNYGILRNLSGGFLPLDEGVYIHKVVGVTITLQSMIHTVVHLLNIGKMSYKQIKEVVLKDSK